MDVKLLKKQLADAERTTKNYDRIVEDMQRENKSPMEVRRILALRRIEEKQRNKIKQILVRLEM